MTQARWLNWYYTGRTATAISAGNSHFFNASVKCWGRNNNGQLGIDNNTSMGDGAGEINVYLGTGRTATAISVDTNILFWTMPLSSAGVGMKMDSLV